MRAPIKLAAAPISVAASISELENLPISSDTILNLAEQAFLTNGYRATSLQDFRAALNEPLRDLFDENFGSKHGLAIALIKRQIHRDHAYFEDLLQRAQFLCSDPLQQMVLFTNLLAESLPLQPKLEQGCLLASLARDQQHLEVEIKQELAEGMDQWRDVYLTQLKTVAAVYPPCIEVSLEDVSDMLTTLLEGGLVLSKLHDESYTISQQIINYRNYLRLLFEPAA